MATPWGARSLVAELRKLQAPFSVSDLAQVAAIEALHHQDRVEERVRRNTAELKRFQDELEARGITHPASQANFVFIRPGGDDATLYRELLERGIIVRPMTQGWLRVTVGTEDENTRFFSALDSVLEEIRPTENHDEVGGSP